jgi:hypothetical protein
LEKGGRSFTSHLYDFADGSEGAFVAEVTKENGMFGRIELNFFLAPTFDGANGEDVFHGAFGEEVELLFRGDFWLGRVETNRGPKVLSQGFITQGRWLLHVAGHSEDPGGSD